MSLALKRNDDETWLEAALRLARPYELVSEVTAVYAQEIARGAPPEFAAFNACYEWDLLEFSADAEEEET